MTGKRYAVRKNLASKYLRWVNEGVGHSYPAPGRQRKICFISHRLL